MRTLLLDQTRWGLCLDANRNLAIASDPYSIAQDVASSARTFQGECYYDTARGVHYLDMILGQAPPLPVLKAQYLGAALLVPGVDSAVCYFSGFTNRMLTGQIICNGGSVIAGF